MALWRNSATYLDNRWTDEPGTSLFGYICLYETVNSYEGEIFMFLITILINISVLQPVKIFLKYMQN